MLQFSCRFAFLLTFVF